MDNTEERRKILKERLLESIDYSRESSDEEIRELIDGMLVRESRQKPISLAERNRLRRELFHAVRKLDVLQELVDDPQITEIMINGPDKIKPFGIRSVLRSARAESKSRKSKTDCQLFSPIKPVSYTHLISQMLLPVSSWISCVRDRTRRRRRPVT